MNEDEEYDIFAAVDTLFKELRQEFESVSEITEEDCASCPNEPECTHSKLKKDRPDGS